MSRLRTNQLGIPGGDLTVLPGNTLYAPGSVIQMQQTVFRSQFSSSVGAGWAAVTGLDCAITPTKNTSKILVSVSMIYGQLYYQLKVRLLRNGSVVTGALGTQAGLRPQSWMTAIELDNGAASSQPIYSMKSMTGWYLDSPASTESLTYRVEIGGYSASFAVYVNRSHNFSDTTTYDSTPISTMTLWEVAQ
jgi:hypothetical protein